MEKFTLRQLEYLVACIDHRSIARAADVLNVSQPTMSVAIAKLEAEFGVQLLLRHQGQGVSAAPSADTIIREARSLIEQASGLTQHARSVGTSLTGRLRLGSFSTLAPVILPSLIRQLAQTHPGIVLDLSEGPQDQLCSDLNAGRLDIALMYDIGLPDHFSADLLDERAPYVALPVGHELAKQSAVSLRELADMPLILLDVAPSREYFLGLFKTHGLAPNIAHSSPSLELVRGMVGQGLGYSILVTRPSGDCTQDGKDLAIRTLVDVVQPSRIALATRRDVRPTRIVSAFKEIARAHVASGAAELVG